MRRRVVMPVVAALGTLLLLPLPASAPRADPIPGVATPNRVVIPFSGYWWSVRNSGNRPSYPGPNVYVVTNAYLDLTGALHVKVTPNLFGQWGAAEVDSLSTMGYGTYTWAVSTPLNDFDPNIALGLFTRSATATESTREIDIEIAKWGRASLEPAQFVVQPAGVQGHLVRTDAPSSKSSTLRFVWAKGRVDFAITDAGRVISRWSFKGASVPKEGENQVSMNLWTYLGRPPTDGKTAEVVISKFSFCKAAAACG